MTGRSAVVSRRITLADSPVRAHDSEIATIARPHLEWMDLARVIAASWVVIIHVAAVPTVHMQSVPTPWWWWANMYDCTARAAVPVFVMISGALLLTSPRLDPQRFFVRRVTKLLVPLIAWTCVYFAWRVWFRHEQVTPMVVLRGVLNGLNTPAYPHLWFLWIVASLYALTPILRPLVASGSRATHVYFAALWFVATGIVPAFERWSGLSLGLLLQPVFGFVGYYVIGASIHRWLPARMARSRAIGCALLFGAASLFAISGTYALSGPKHVVDESLMEPLAGNVIVMSVTACLLLRHIGESLFTAGALLGEWRDRLRQASALTFGIYLIHPLILDLLARFGGLPLDPLPHNPVWYVPFVATMALVSSALSVAVLRIIPGVRSVVP